jgi:hypothetical protein
MSIMTRPGLVLVLLLAAVAAAEERYVPVGAGATELQIVNTSAQRAGVEIALPGNEATRVELAPGETLQRTIVEDDLGVVRIGGDAALRVTATTHSGEATASVPVVWARDAVVVDADGLKPVSTLGWRSGILAVNPDDATAFAMVDGWLRWIAPRGAIRGTAVRARTPMLLFTYSINHATGARVFTAITPHAAGRKHRAVRSVTPTEPQPQPQTVTLTPSKDNTLFESSDGSISNGVGPHLFAGKTASGSRRRALLAFNIAGQIPPGSRITRVALTLHVSQTISGADTVALHRAAADWGEGNSNAGLSRDGSGTGARTGDATWLHTFFSNSRWSTAGGDFDAATDATTSVASASGRWESAAMIARVQQWLDQPATNFGWLVTANESRNTSAKRFDSREVQSQTSRPSLTVDFEH